MSAEEDADLRDLVAHTLENNGVLGKIKAELRAKVFMVLEAHDKNETNQPSAVNEKLRNFMNTKEGRIATGLVREFMEFFELEYSLAVFDPETNFGDCYKGREGLMEELDISSIANNGSKPILASVLENVSKGMPKLDLGIFNEEKVKKSLISPESSPRSLSSGSRNNSPRVSRIPQRVKDKKIEKSDLKYAKSEISSEKAREEEAKSGHTGNADLSLSLNDDDILAEFTQPRHGTAKGKADEENLSGDDLTSGSHKASWYQSGSNFGLVKNGSLSGIKDQTAASSSPDLKELAEIDRRINELGFGLPAEDKAASHGDDFNDSYADDFHASTHSNEDNSSIPEEIEGDPLSLGSYRSEGSKADDLVTSDRIVSPHGDYQDFDYGEHVANF